VRQPPAELTDPLSRGPARRHLVLVACAALAAAVAMLSLAGLSGRNADATLGATRPAAGTGPLGQPAAIAGAPTTGDQAAAVVVHIKNYAFAPATLKITTGQKVTWINDDSAPHTVTTTSGPKKIDSGQIKQGASFSYTFGTPGTYAYYCAYHPDMKAAITVSGGTAPSPTASPTGGPSPTGMPMPTSTPTGQPAPTGTATPPGGSPTPPPGGGTTCTAALNDILTVVMQHIYTAHLERSPSQQVADALALDQYVKTHTAWVQMILASGVTGVQAFLQGLQPLLQHVYLAHLERSPAEQVSDALALDQYLKTHTVLVEDILKPGLDGLLGGGTC
jgi:plastocyanin